MPTINEILRDKLTPHQFDAATDARNEVLCLACAGSGKSRTLAYRIARLIAEGEDPNSIIAFTFTNKAAESIKMRVASALAECGFDPTLLGAMYIGTIDSYCNNLLGMLDASHRQFDMLDNNRLILFLMSRYHDIGLYPLRNERGRAPYFKTIKETINAWQTVNNELLDINDIEERDPTLGTALQRLKENMMTSRFIDFSYTIRLTIEEIQNNTDGRASRALEGIKHIMVDEYQDVNPSQEHLITSIYNHADTLFVVGDDDQAIYSWRGADVTNILDFEDRYPSCGKHELTTNFRSTPTIINSSVRFAERQLGSSRHPKTPEPCAENMEVPNQVAKLWFDSRVEEAEWVAQRIRYLLGKSYFDNELGRIRGLTLGDFAILMKVTHGSGDETRHLAFARALENVSLDYFIESQGSIFQRQVADVLRTTFGLLRDGNPDRIIVSDHWNNVVLPVYPNGDFNAFVQVMTEWGRLIHTPHTGARRRVYPQDLLHRLLAVFRYSDEDFAFIDNRAIGGFSTIMLDIESVYMSIDSTSRFKDVLNFLDNIAEDGYETSQDIVLQRPDLISISTVHKAKGLEFPVVFLVDLENQRFPGPVDRRYKGWLPQDIIGPAFNLGRYANTRENDARLFYTAVTRAERYLYLSGCRDLPTGIRQWRISEFSLEFVNDRIIENPNELPTGIEEAVPEPRIDDSIKPTSYSEIRYYLSCPKEYQFRKQYGFNPSVPALFGFGQTTHAIIGKLHETARESVPSSEQIDSAVDRTFHLKHVPESNNPVTSPGPYEFAREKSRIMARQYVNDYAEDFYAERQVEARFEIPAENTVISGAIDLLLRQDADGRILEATVIDFKSIELGEGNAVEKSKIDWISLSLQVQLYALAARNVLSENAKVGNVHFLVDSQRVEIPVSEEAVDAALKNVEWAVNKIINRDYPMRPETNKCSNCDFTRICSKRPESFNTDDIPPSICTPNGDSLISAYSNFEEA
jgi:ATP-dependent DNA helicase UvrD/PcrA